MLQTPDWTEAGSPGPDGLGAATPAGPVAQRGAPSEGQSELRVGLIDAGSEHELVVGGEHGALLDAGGI